MISFLYKHFGDNTVRSWVARFGNSMTAIAVRFLALGRRYVKEINKHCTDSRSDTFVDSKKALHAKIDAILQRQRKEYTSYAYFYGLPYQSLGILDVFGERPTEERFDHYGLRDIITKDDVVLDIGCNCGFMGIITAYRTGCRVEGIDINPYMIEIGQACAYYLHLSDLVSLRAMPFQTYTGDGRFSVVFSFATHWTDDENYRVDLVDHLAKIHSLMTPGGTLVFESHAADVGVPEFYAALERARHLFSWDGIHRQVDNGTRELYIMKSLPQ